MGRAPLQAGTKAYCARHPGQRAGHIWMVNKAFDVFFSLCLIVITLNIIPARDQNVYFRLQDFACPIAAKKGSFFSVET